MAQISFWTYVLNNSSITLDSSFGLKNISIELISGTGTFTGQMFAGGISSIPVSLYVNKPVNFTTNSINTIAGLTITTTGVVNIIAF